MFIQLTSLRKSMLSKQAGSGPVAFVIRGHLYAVDLEKIRATAISEGASVQSFVLSHEEFV